MSVRLKRETDAGDTDVATNPSVTVFTEEELDALESKRTIPHFVFFPAGLAGLYLIEHPWPIDHWLISAISMLFSGFTFLCWTSCFHETVHQTLTSSRTLSIFLGRLLGCLALIPYNVYRESHIRHHAYLNKPNDWELWPYSDPSASLAFRRAFVWVDLFFGAVTAPYIYARIFFHRNSPITNPPLRRTIRNEYIGVVAFWAVVLTMIGTFGNWQSFLMVWVGPHLIAAVYQTWRKLTEHLGMQSYDPLEGTRTVVGDTLLTRLCSYLNFNIFVHGPHHRHPRIAHTKLEAKMQHYINEFPDRTFPVFQRYSHASLDMMSWLFKNPGVGMNVGAQAPSSSEGEQEATNFAQDVSKQDVPKQDAPKDVLRKAA